ncbi:hypothetical protein VRZ77_21605, partial [Ancylobacter sp. G4_0304]
MLLDYSSLLAGTGFSALCLALILFASSMAARRDGFLLTYAVAALMIVGAVITYSIYISGPDDRLIILSFSLMLACMSTLLGAARQFRLGVSPLPIIGVAAISIPLERFLADPIQSGIPKSRHVCFLRVRSGGDGSCRAPTARICGI